MELNNKRKKIVVVGAGFAGFELIRKLKHKNYEIVLLDKNNYYQFQPLMYQVATCGLEQSSITYPLRKTLAKMGNKNFKMCNVLKIDTEKKIVHTSKEDESYDILVIGIGCSTNFFGDKEIQKNAFQLKSVPEALAIKNKILSALESSVYIKDDKELKENLNFTIVGGGATGVELAGALADIKRTSLPKDFPEIDFSKMEIHLIDGAARLLKGMSHKASLIAEQTLTKRGVILHQQERVASYDGSTIVLKSEKKLRTKNLFWVAGVIANKIEGFSEESYIKNRLIVDQYNQVINYPDVYAIGDGCIMQIEDYPEGHPQLGSVAMQMARNLAHNLNNKIANKKQKPFNYFDRGTMATIGRSAAVADIRKVHFGGFFAWIAWLLVHLILLNGVRNKVSALWNWMWKYLTYDTSLMYLLIPDKNNREEE